MFNCFLFLERPLRLEHFEVNDVNREREKERERERERESCLCCFLQHIQYGASRNQACRRRCQIVQNSVRMFTQDEPYAWSTRGHPMTFSSKSHRA